MDEVLTSVNAFGKFQHLATFLVGLSSILISIVHYSTVFIIADPGLICSKKCENETILFTNSKETCQIWSNLSKASNTTSEFSCHFDKTYYGLSIVNEWGLVCEKKYLASMTQTCFLLGSLLSMFIGPFSDRFGRKYFSNILIVLLCLTIITSELLQTNYLNLHITKRYYFFSISQLIIGACANAIYSTLFILLLEFTTAKYSTQITKVNLYMYVLGELIILVIAYFARDWHIINWITVFLSILVVTVIGLFLPESPRYLIQKKKFRKAFQVLKKINKINGKKSNELQDDNNIQLLLQRSQADFTMINTSIIQKFNLITSGKNQTTSTEIVAEVEDQSALQYLLKSKKNSAQTILLILAWFFTTLSFAGISLGITSVGQVNPYFMFFLASIAELVGYILCFLNDRFGRKRMMIVFSGLVGLTFLFVAFIPINNDEKSNMFDYNKLLIIICASIGKSMSAASINSLYIYTSQLYPTSVRVTLLLFVSSIGRLGSVLSPSINLLGSLVWKPLPYFIFSFCAFMTSLFVLVLPDPDKLDLF